VANATHFENERNPAVEAEVSEDDFAQCPCDAEVAADAIDRNVGARIVLEVSAFIVDVNVDTRPLSVTVAAAEREAVFRRIRRSVTDACRIVYQSGLLS